MPSQSAANRPLLSVIIPVYNIANYLRESLDSMLAQTFGDWEAILVDDGSTDTSGAVCDEYAQRDTRFRVIHQPNKGLSGARNAGIAAARGPLIGFLDPDDWIEPTMFETLVGMLDNGDIDVATCKIVKEYVNRQVVFPRHSSQERIITRQEALAHILRDKDFKSYVWNKVYRRHVISVPFPDGMLYEDYIAMPQWLANVKNIAYTPKPLYHYRQRGSGVVNSLSPDKMMGLLNANLIRARIVPKLEGVEANEDELAEKVVSSAVNVAKRIVLKLPPSQERANALQTVVRQSLPYYKQTARRLPLIVRFRYWCLTTNPSAFATMMRLDYRLQTRHLHPKPQLFD